MHSCVFQRRSKLHEFTGWVQFVQWCNLNSLKKLPVFVFPKCTTLSWRCHSVSNLFRNNPQRYEELILFLFWHLGKIPKDLLSQSSYFVRIVKRWDYGRKSASSYCFGTLFSFKSYLHKTYFHLTSTSYTPDQPNSHSLISIR